MATSTEAIDESQLKKAPRVELPHPARSDSAWIRWAAQTHRSRFPVKALQLMFSDHRVIEAEKGRGREAKHQPRPDALPVKLRFLRTAEQDEVGLHPKQHAG